MGCGMTHRAKPGRVLEGHDFSRAVSAGQSQRALAPEGCLSIRPALSLRILALLAVLCLSSVSARAATYYVIVAGLGGEPDYDQRFTAAAKDLDRVFKSASEMAHVFTLI